MGSFKTDLKRSKIISLVSFGILYFYNGYFHAFSIPFERSLFDGIKMSNDTAII